MTDEQYAELRATLIEALLELKRMVSLLAEIRDELVDEEDDDDEKGYLS